MISVKPIIMLSGVRSSWLTLATNSALAWPRDVLEALSGPTAAFAPGWPLSRSSHQGRPGAARAPPGGGWPVRSPTATILDRQQRPTTATQQSGERWQSGWPAPEPGAGGAEHREVAHQATASTTNSLTSATQPTVTIAPEAAARIVKATCGWSNRNTRASAGQPPCQTNCASVMLRQSRYAPGL